MRNRVLRDPSRAWHVRIRPRAGRSCRGDGRFLRRSSGRKRCSPLVAPGIGRRNIVAQRQSAVSPRRRERRPSKRLPGAPRPATKPVASFRRSPRRPEIWPAKQDPWIRILAEACLVSQPPSAHDVRHSMHLPQRRNSSTFQPGIIPSPRCGLSRNSSFLNNPRGCTGLSRVPRRQLHRGIGRRPVRGSTIHGLHGAEG
jgi:hypothetical protein